MKDKKLIYIAIIMICLTVILGISYAWFNTIIEGNENAKKHTVSPGDLRLTYTDTDTITLENAFPGDSYEKTVSVKNSGTTNTNYSLVWQELTNNIINNELVIEGTCKRLNSSGTEEGTCENIKQRGISSLIIESNILIEPGYTHEYSLKVTFLDTGTEQNYNKKKSFNGKIGIEEYQVTAFREDDWSTIVANVKTGNTDKYNIGDIREIDLGKYGIHTVRVANKSTPEECSTEGFSQTACGFVLEFNNIIDLGKLSQYSSISGGWPDTLVHQNLNEQVYYSFPSDLIENVLDTYVVSSNTTRIVSSTDKLYLLSASEVYTDWASSTTGSYDYSAKSSRQLDYYSLNNKSSNYAKKYGTSYSKYWLRNVNRHGSHFFYVSGSGSLNWEDANYEYGISPAFRIG